MKNHTIKKHRDEIEIMRTPLNKIKTLDFLDEDNYSESYYAYDTVKKTTCILILSKKPTSWIYEIKY